MNQQQTPSSITHRRRVSILDSSIAKKIAAGEVIDRPFSVVRELLDNSIDAGATQIQVKLVDGGKEEITVSDNGFGMEKDDLSLCWKSHATSKISSESDLYNITTHGFRGEALSAIAEISRLVIKTKASESKNGLKLEVDAGKERYLGSAAAAPGTSISVSDIFFNLPGRRKFLKQAAAESTLCKQTLIDHATVYPDIEFKLSKVKKNGVTDLEIYPIPQEENPDQRQIQRLMQIHGNKLHHDLLYPIQLSGDSFSIKAILAEPGLNRSDKRMVQIFCNRRKIWDYGLQQAVLYGYEGFMPGGSFPVAFIFIENDPSLMDVNIHPAKKEIKLRNFSEIHHRLSSGIRDFLKHNALKMVKNQSFIQSKELDFRINSATNPPISQRGSLSDQGVQNRHSQVDIVAERSKASQYSSGENSTPVQNKPRSYYNTSYSTPFPDSHPINPKRADDKKKEDSANSFSYKGQLFNLFLLAEKNDRLFIVDMHAAHEKIIFDSFLHDSNGTSQKLLIPIEIELESEQLKNITPEELNAKGFEVQIKDNTLFIEAIPRAFVEKEKLIGEYFQAMGESKKDILYDLYATMACRSAVMDGDTIDDETACMIIAQAFEMDVPRCPHGRPIWFELSREELFKLVART